jgi:tRNA threonylcarbamoyl adenosine modification protein YjeE
LQDQLLFDVTIPASGLEGLAQKLSTYLKDPFCLWLVGEMGTGKTTITRYILRQLGLSPQIPVTSPTYTYVNEYRIKDRLIGHLDLYRTNGVLNPEEFGLGGERDFSGVIVEWPELGGESPALHPTHTLVINYQDDPTVRNYRFFARTDRKKSETQKTPH